MTDTMDITEIHEDATAGVEVQEESADEEIPRTLAVLPDEVSNETIAVPLLGGKKPRAKPAPKEYDADGNLVPKVKTPRKPAAPKTDEAGNPIVKAARKPAAPKLDDEGKPVAKTPRKPVAAKLNEDGSPIIKKTPVKRTKLPNAATPTAIADDPFVAAPGTPIPATPTMAIPTPKGARTPKRVNETVGDECGSPTPAKKAKISTASAKADLGSDGLPILSPPDAIVFEMRAENKPWAECLTAYVAAGGPATSTVNAVSKRYAKLAADRVSFTAEEVNALMNASTTISASNAVAKIALKAKFDAEFKALDGHKWANIKKQMEDALPSSKAKFSTMQLQKKVDEMSATWVQLEQGQPSTNEAADAKAEENHSQASALAVENADQNRIDAMDEDEVAA